MVVPCQWHRYNKCDIRGRSRVIPLCVARPQVTNVIQQISKLAGGQFVEPQCPFSDPPCPLRAYDGVRQKAAILGDIGHDADSIAALNRKGVVSNA